jgi:hypothetical protein
MSDKQFAMEQRVTDAERLERERERLAALLPGGSVDRPIEVTSSAVIEGRAEDSTPCPHCGGQNRVIEHTRPVPSRRRVDVECRYCGTPRTLWFRIVPDVVN